MTPEHAAPDPFALRAEVGTDAYTVELRALRLQIQPGPLPPRDWQRAVQQLKARQRWEDLETQHLRRLPVLARRRHLQVLHPQTVVGGLDVSAYPLGLSSICVLGLVSLNAQLGDLGLMLSLLGGASTMFVFDHALTRSYQRALKSFGLESGQEAR